MPCLNLDLDYFSHPKTKRLVGLLGRGAEVLPIKLWSYCGKFHSEDGRLTGYTVQEIESIVEWWGKPGESVTALVRVGYLHNEGDAFRIHQWAEHEGHIVAFRERAKVGAQARWSKIKGECLTDATSIAKGGAEQCPIPTKPPDPTGPKNSDAAHPSGDESSAVKTRKRAKPKEPVFPEGVWDRAVAGWGRAAKATHGSDFRWNSRQYKGLRDVLVALDGDIGRFETVAKAWLREPEVGKAKGHPLYQLAEDLNYIESKIAKGTVGHGVTKPTAAERGEFPEERIDLPTKRRSLAGGVSANGNSA